MTIPDLDNFTLLQVLFAEPPPVRVSLMSCNTIPLHGTLLLQSNSMATEVALVPVMFLYVTPLIATAEFYMHRDQLIKEQ